MLWRVRSTAPAPKPPPPTPRSSRSGRKCSSCAGIMSAGCSRSKSGSESSRLPASLRGHNLSAASRLVAAPPPAGSSRCAAGAPGAGTNEAAPSGGDQAGPRVRPGAVPAGLRNVGPRHPRAPPTDRSRERFEQVLQDFVDIGGYVRAGYGRDSQGGPQVAFQAPGALAKYRLGNEAENYGELIFGKNWYVPGMFGLDPKERPDGTPTGPIAHAQVRLSFYNPYSSYNSGADTDVRRARSLGGHRQCGGSPALDEVLGRQPLLPPSRHSHQRLLLLQHERRRRRRGGFPTALRQSRLGVDRQRLRERPLHAISAQPRPQRTRPASAKATGTCGSTMCRCRWARASSTSSMPPPTPAWIRTATPSRAPTASPSPSSTGRAALRRAGLQHVLPPVRQRRRPRPSPPASRPSATTASLTSGPTRTTPGGSGLPNISWCSPASISPSARRWFINTPITATAYGSQDWFSAGVRPIWEINKYFSVAG